MKRIIFISSLLILLAFNSNAQIVNVESARMQSDSVGWKGGVGAAFSMSDNGNKILGIDAQSHIQYKTSNNRGIWLFLTDFNFLKIGKRESIHNFLAHLRYNFKINPWLRWEVFTQYQDNAITDIQSRYLLGTGPRFKLIDQKYFRMYIGILFMYETEKEATIPEIKHHDIRNSSYVSFTWVPNKFVELISTSYFQPRLDKPGDNRFLNQTSFKVKASPHFSMSTRLNFLHDRFPAGTAPRTTYSFATGFDYDF